MILTKSSGSDDEMVWSATIAVGRNAAENDALFSKAKQTDIWFHLHNLPSAHVYLSITGNPSKACIKSLVQECANLVKQYSKCASNAKVDYVKKRYISKGNKPGEVVMRKRPGIV